MARHRISVITITYCDDAGLRKTLESVASLVGPFELEHVVVDGAARDETRRIIDEVGTSSILISEADRGRYHAMNKGIARATGDVLWFMNSGDVFATVDAVTIALASLRDPRNQWGYGAQYILNRRGRPKAWTGRREFDLARFARGVTIPHQAAYFGADLVAAIGPYDEDFGLAADQLFIMRAALHAEPRQSWTVLALFDGGGAGSHRVPHEYAIDFWRIRRITGVSITGSRWRDFVITAADAVRGDVNYLLHEVSAHLPAGRT